MQYQKLANWQLAELLVAEKTGGKVICPPVWDKDGKLLSQGGSYKKHDIMLPDSTLIAVKYLPKQFKMSSAVYTNIADKRDTRDVSLYIQGKGSLNKAIQDLVKQEYIPCYTSGRNAPVKSDRKNRFMAVTDLQTAINIYDLECQVLEFEARLIDRIVRRKYQKVPAITIGLYQVLTKPDSVILL